MSRHYHLLWSLGSRDHWGLALALSPHIVPLTRTHAQGGTGSPSSTTLGHQVLLPLPVLQPCLHLLCQDPQYRLRMLDWTLHLAQGPAPVIKVLPRGKEAGRISDKQVASASSSRASLLISSDLESNPQQPQQALAMLARSWRNSPSPHPELKGKGSPVKAASRRPTRGEQQKDRA